MSVWCEKPICRKSANGKLSEFGRRVCQICKDSFKAYLLQNKEASFSFRGKSYRVTFTGVAVFPQGFSAVADRLREFKGVNMLCDIGNGTMNIMYINNGKPVSSRCYTEKFGTQQCMIAVREKLMQRRYFVSGRQTSGNSILTPFGNPLPSTLPESCAACGSMSTTRS